MSSESVKDIEVELRTYDVDGDALRATLRTLGAVSLGELVFKRAVLDVYPADPNKWIRVRSNGIETTLAVKQRGTATEMDGEIEERVESFETTLQLLASLGFEPRSVQESRSDIYTIDGTEVSIDTWPGLKELLEIEAKDTHASVGERTATIYKVAEKLGIPVEALTTESIEQRYMDTLGIDVKTTSLTFDTL
ncbi:MAG: CYTH domain-containing protein [Candidatus Microsaccharimonas sossegonensis]|uniref:CYTH domain-containing protein n=1 Tax=Candidatus Microsaccharimonas sossegonensis TaxID=2506948 RepID=A0A4Q0AHR2_9BACT|nr:MAG: CYTH domain-containing protein [Candidatus Microsaccharimonas sossegonensis]